MEALLRGSQFASNDLYFAELRRFNIIADHQVLPRGQTHGKRGMSCQGQTSGLFAKRVVDPMGKSLATQHLSHDDKGLCILRPGSVSSVLLNCVRSLAMQYEEPEERNHSLGMRSFYHFLHMASRNFGRSLFWMIYSTCHLKHI